MRKGEQETVHNKKKGEREEGGVGGRLAAGVENLHPYGRLNYSLLFITKNSKIVVEIRKFQYIPSIFLWPPTIAYVVKM